MPEKILSRHFALNKDTIEDVEKIKEELRSVKQDYDNLVTLVADVICVAENIEVRFDSYEDRDAYDDSINNLTNFFKKKDLT